MMGGVGEAARHDPGARAWDVKEQCGRFPPGIVCRAQALQAASAVLGVASDELDARFDRRQWRRIDVDTQHRSKPIVLTDALVNQVLENAATAWIVQLRTDLEVVVSKLTPDAQSLDALAVVAVD